MKPKYYAILSNAIEAGCRLGVHRAHKHTDDPTFDEIEHQVHTAIMQCIDEVFSFEAEEKP